MIGNRNSRANQKWRAEHPDGPDLPDEPQDDDEGIEVYHDITAKKPEPPPVEGPLAFDQVRQLVTMGMPIKEVRELNAEGYTYEQIAQLAQAQVSARREADQRTADAIQAGTSSAIAANQPKRHSREDADYDRVSVFNPEGDRLHPRPGLKCKMYWGVIQGTPDNPKPPFPLYDIEPDACTMQEQIALNKLEPIRTKITLNDGTEAPLHVVPSTDPITGEMTRLVIALPRDMYNPVSRVQVPPLVTLARSLAPA